MNNKHILLGFSAIELTSIWPSTASDLIPHKKKSLNFYQHFVLLGLILIQDSGVREA